MFAIKAFDPDQDDSSFINESSILTQIKERCSSCPAVFIYGIIDQKQIINAEIGNKILQFQHLDPEGLYNNYIRSGRVDDVKMGNKIILLEYLDPKEWVTLNDLDKAMDRKQFFIRLPSIIENIFTGLDDIHSLGIIHDDLAGQNIMINLKNSKIKFETMGTIYCFIDLKFLIEKLNNMMGFTTEDEEISVGY